MAKLNQKARYATPRRRKWRKRKAAKGKGKGRGGHGDDGDDVDDIGESSGDEQNWTDNLSKNMARLAATMNRDLLHKTILPYFTGWCQTEEGIRTGMLTGHVFDVFPGPCSVCAENPEVSCE